MLAILVALAASMSYGVGDFLAGHQTRRTSLWSVLVVSQFASVTVMGIVVLARGHGLPDGVLLPALVAGLTAIATLAVAYQALAIGVMGIVSPIMGLGTIVPMTVGLARGERPSALQLAGVAIALGGAFLAAHEKSAREHHQKTSKLSVVLALLAALLFGSSFVFSAQAAEADPYWGVFFARVTALTTIVLAFAIMRPHLHLNRKTAVPLLSIGVADTSAYMLFSVASTLGFLSIVSVLSSIYPAFVVMFAYIFLHERLAPVQRVGVVSTLAGVALIAAG